MKKKIYFFESNIPMSKTIYLPLVSGILQAYAQSFPAISDAYEFMPYIFMRDVPLKMLKDVRDPFIMCFSVCLWNEQLSLAAAKIIKHVWKDCIIVFGGPQVLKDDTERYPFIDYVIQEEGEKKFVNLLARLIGAEIHVDQHNLSNFPSPYTLGLFERIISDNVDIDFQAIVETNRGCPFTCSFCIDANTEITTPYGNKKVVNLQLSDKILGWDEAKEKYVWNKFQEVLCTGKKELFRIETEDSYVETTRDHRIYTLTGWKQAHEIRVGEYVLAGTLFHSNEAKQSNESEGCSRQGIDDIETKSCERRNNYVYADRSRKKNNKSYSENEQSKQKTRESQETISENDIEQPNETTRSSGKAIQDIKRKNSEWEDSSLDVHSRREKNDRGNSKRKTVWSEQSNVQLKNSSENVEDFKGETFRCQIRKDDCEQSYEESDSTGKGKECSKQRRDSKNLFKKLAKTSELVRKHCSEFFTRAQFTFSIYRQCWNMDWPLCFGNLQESRFRSYRQEDQETNIGAWPLLAFFQSSSNRIKRLFEPGLGVFHYLGRRQARSTNDEQNKDFSWRKVESICSVGVRDVYDVVNVIPTSNFFANGILVHNCYWGQGFEEKKVRHHTLDHVREEAEWIGKNRIKYVFMADANFGMYERDYEVARIYCETKKRYGYPEKIRVCYGKNKEENVFKVASLMHSQDLTKAVTLARQSNDVTALKNIQRSNIKLEVYDKLRDRYNAEGIPTYTEIILGMPGETKESFLKGIEEIAGTPTQLFVYHCTILPNTGMADPEYIKKHGIVTVRIPLAEIHGQYRDPNFVQEYEDIVIQTNTMSVNEWIDCAVYAWMAQLKFVFGVNDVPGWVSDYFYRIAVGITQGNCRAQYDPGYGDIYWEPEEMAYLTICMSRGLIDEDPKEFARKNVLWGRKSKVQKQNKIDRRPIVAPELAKVLSI